MGLTHPNTYLASKSGDIPKSPQPPSPVQNDRIQTHPLLLRDVLGRNSASDSIIPPELATARSTFEPPGSYQEPVVNPSASPPAADLRHAKVFHPPYDLDQDPLEGHHTTSSMT